MSLLAAHHNSMPSSRQPGRRARARPGASGNGSSGGGLARLFAPVARLLAPLNDPANKTAHLGVAAVLLLAEAVLCLLIIRRVPYTEIDWEAYMQEVTGYLEGERDYSKLRGDTGPLVYPAGFVYLFAWLKGVTGGSVQAAQHIFAGLYLATQAAVMALYIRTASLPPWSLALLAASRRLHSIYLLRLFNDCWAMLVAYLATLALQGRRWVLAVVLYSLAVSVKMNVLLMAPGVLAVLIKHARLRDVLAGTALGVGLQAALAAPFLRTYPHSYLTRAFEFSREFTFKWSVNLAFLPEAAFTSRQLALALMFLHLRLLWSLAQKSWLGAEGGVLPALRRAFLSPPPSAAAAPGRKGADSSGGASDGASASATPGGAASFEDSVLFIVFSSNLIGILCARTMHYQFYSWYFHTLPFLLLRSPLPARWVVAVLGCIEFVYNVYPPHPWAAAALQGLHLVLLGAAFNYRGAPAAGRKGSAGDGAKAATAAAAAAAAAAVTSPRQGEAAARRTRRRG